MNYHNDSVCVFSIEKLLRKINQKIQTSLIEDPEDLVRKIENAKLALIMDNMMFPDTDLRVTSSSFTYTPVKPPVNPKLEELFNQIEEQEKKSKKKKKNFQTKGKETRSVEANTGCLLISDTRALVYKPPVLLPSLRTLENEYQIDVLKDKLAKARKKLTTYQSFKLYESQLPKMKEENDYLFGEIQAQKIQLNNIKDNKDKWIKRTKRIIKQKWEVFNQKKNEAYANINSAYKKMKNKYHSYRQEQNRFNEARKAWTKPRSKREWARFWNKMANAQDKTPEYYEGCWENS
jgi:hypothetical protein